MVTNTIDSETDRSTRLAGSAVSRRVGAALYHLWVAAKFIAPIVAMILIWQLAVQSGFIDSRIIPSPGTIIARAVQLLSPAADFVLLNHIGISMLRALGAFLIAAAIGIPLGFWLGLSPAAFAWTSPILSLLLPLPAVAWAPVFLVAFGQGTTTILTLCVLGAIFPILYSTIQGVRAIPRHSVWALQSMGANRRQIFFGVLIPASLPPLITGCKLGLAHSWRTLVAAEMLAALDYGLGYMIFAAREYMDGATMFVGIVLLAALGFLFEQVAFGAIEARTVRRWYAFRRIGA